jgi:hypothetical protein
MAVKEKQDVCSLTRAHGISHFGLRGELSDLYTLSVLEFDGLIDNNPAVEWRKQYGQKNKGFVIYGLKPECRGTLIYADTSDLEVKSLNPATHLVSVGNTEGTNTRIVLSRKIHSSWVLRKIEKNIYEGYNGKKINIFPYNMTLLTNLDWYMLTDLIQGGHEETKVLGSDLNEWIVNNKSIESGKQYFVIYNRGQSELFIGTALTILSFIALHIGCIRSLRGAAA